MAGVAVIRDEMPDDRAAIHAVVAAAFGRRAEADLVERLREGGDLAVSLVAVEGAAIVGHLALSPMKASFRALGLAPLSVLPARQGTGIGSQVIRKALARVDREGWHAVFVLGNPDYYQRFDFDVRAAAGFASPDAGPHFMVRLQPGGVCPPAGGVDFAPAFAAL
jgi:putative acetyltransferase